jgi:ATP-dependent exoDNAse (exonuclease V) alpha subunit
MLLAEEVAPAAATAALLTEWAKDKELYKTLILAGTHEEVNWLNREAQELRRKSGQLGTRWSKIGEREFYPGDRVIFGRNDRKLGVKHGTFGTFVEERQGSAIIQLDPDNKRVYVPLSHEHVRLGYAVTTHKSQGATVNRAFVLFSDVMQSRESTYVQISRAREFTKLFLTQDQAGDDELRDAVRAMERSQAKLNATELADPGLSPVTELHPRNPRSPGLSLAA